MRTEAARDSIFKGSHPGVPPGPTHRLVMNVDCVCRNDHLKADVAWQRNRPLVSGSDLITGATGGGAAAAAPLGVSAKKTLSSCRLRGRRRCVK